MLLITHRPARNLTLDKKEGVLCFMNAASHGGTRHTIALHAFMHVPSMVYGTVRRHGKIAKQGYMEDRQNKDILDRQEKA